jgi:hypothetical protein
MVAEEALPLAMLQPGAALTGALTFTPGPLTVQLGVFPCTLLAVQAMVVLCPLFTRSGVAVRVRSAVPLLQVVPPVTVTCEGLQKVVGEFEAFTCIW